jgi:uncharacterized protein YueI
VEKELQNVKEENELLKAENLSLENRSEELYLNLQMEKAKYTGVLLQTDENRY